MLRGVSVVYVNAARGASFTLHPATRTAFTSSQSSLTFALRQHARRLATNSPPTTSTATSASTTTGASTAAAAAAPAAPAVSFFKSATWAKTVGTIGALANWTIPLAAMAHIAQQRDPATTIDPVMTSSLAIYSLLFMRWSLAIAPTNYPLFICHFANEIAQLTQLGRYAAAEKKPGVPKKPEAVPLD